MRFRDATESDAEFLAEFGARAFRAAYAADNDPANLQRYVMSAFSTEQIARELVLPGSRYVLAVDTVEGRDAIVGYAWLRIGEGTDTVDARRPVELVRIYVDPELTGRGYGATLLQECVDQVRGAGGDVLWLGVWERNDGAIRFYERHGFRQVGEQEYRLGDEAQTDRVYARPIRPHQRLG